MVFLSRNAHVNLYKAGKGDLSFLMYAENIRKLGEQKATVEKSVTET